MSGIAIFLIIQACVYGLLGVTNLLFTRKRLSYVFGQDYALTELDLFWQRDIGIFQIGLATLATYTYFTALPNPQSTLVTLGTVWSMGAIFLASTGLFNKKLEHITSPQAAIGIATVSVIFGGLNWYFLVQSI